MLWSTLICVGSMRLLLRLIVLKVDCYRSIFMKGRQLWVKENCARLRISVEILPYLILFLITNVFTNNYQLFLFTSIFRSLHFALNSLYKMSYSSLTISSFLWGTLCILTDCLLRLPPTVWVVFRPIWVLMRVRESAKVCPCVYVLALLRRELIFSRSFFIIILLCSLLLCLNRWFIISITHHGNYLLLGGKDP